MVDGWVIKTTKDDLDVPEPIKGLKVLLNDVEMRTNYGGFS